MSITPKAIQDLLDELEASKQSRLRAWAVLQRIRAILSESAHMVIEQPAKKTFESEGAILERALTKCIRDRQAALKDLADAAMRVDKAASASRRTSAQHTRRFLRRWIKQGILFRSLKSSFKRLHHKHCYAGFLTFARACDIENRDRIVGQE